MRIIPGVIASAWKSWRKHPPLDESLDAKLVFKNMVFDDLWEDAEMVELVVWLRGNRHLTIPAEWRPYLPTKIQLGQP